jgi:phosphoglycolate phosphatase-like HAD superfamily hydrolase
MRLDQRKPTGVRCPRDDVRLEALGIRYGMRFGTARQWERQMDIRRECTESLLSTITVRHNVTRDDALAAGEQRELLVDLALVFLPIDALMMFSAGFVAARVRQRFETDEARSRRSRSSPCRWSSACSSSWGWSDVVVAGRNGTPWLALSTLTASGSSASRCSRTRPIPAFRAPLDELTMRGHTLCVVTSKPRLYAIRILEHFALAPFFREVYGPALRYRKYDKESLIRGACTTESVKSSHAIMIGDRAEDILGARRNGPRSIGVSWGYSERGELEAARPGWLVHRTEELMQCIATRAGSGIPECSGDQHGVERRGRSARPGSADGEAQ